MNFKNVSIIKICSILSILTVVISLTLAFSNRKDSNNSVDLYNNTTYLIPIGSYDLNIEDLNKNDIIVKVNTLDKIEKSNGTIKTIVDIVDILQGEITYEQINIYDENSIFIDTNTNTNYISLYANNILLPNKTYYLILEEIEDKPWYMPYNSYRLKDDLSLFKDSTSYKLIPQESVEQYELNVLKDISYFFGKEEYILQYQNRISDLKKEFPYIGISS